jgi:hypothetical protein
MTVFELAFYYKKNHSKWSCEGGYITDLLEVCFQIRVLTKPFPKLLLPQSLTCSSSNHELHEIDWLKSREIMLTEEERKYCSYLAFSKPQKLDFEEIITHATPKIERIKLYPWWRR